VSGIAAYSTLHAAGIDNHESWQAILTGRSGLRPNTLPWCDLPTWIGEVVAADFERPAPKAFFDEVVYRDKTITVNGQAWPQKPESTYSYLEGLTYATTQRLDERIGDRMHSIAINPAAPPVNVGGVRSFPGRENCVYNDRGFRCKVPSGSYFMMGDNRDNSDDSRYWGFVPDDHIRGKAFFIWFNWDDISSFAFKRIGTSIR